MQPPDAHPPSAPRGAPRVGTALEFALSRIGLGEDTAALEDIVESCHLQFLIFMHYSCMYAGKKYVYFDQDGFVSLLDSR